MNLLAHSQIVDLKTLLPSEPPRLRGAIVNG